MMLPSIFSDDEERGSAGRRTDPVRHAVRPPEGSRPHAARPKSGGKKLQTAVCSEADAEGPMYVEPPGYTTPSAPSNSSEMPACVGKVRRSQAGHFTCESGRPTFDVVPTPSNESQELLPYPPSVNRGMQEVVEALKDQKLHIISIGIGEEMPRVVSTERRGGTEKPEELFGFHRAQAIIILLQQKSLHNACKFLQELRTREARQKKKTFKGFPPVVTIVLRDGPLELRRVQPITEELLKGGADIAFIEPTTKKDLPALLASSLPSVRFLLDSKKFAVEDHANQLFWKDAPALLQISHKHERAHVFPNLNTSIKEIEADGKELGGVGRHMFKKMLGCGGCGKVYAFEHSDGKKEVAKVIPKAYIKCRENAKQILRECYFMRRVHEHPNIVTFNGFAHARRNLYIYMEYGGDMNLLDLISRRERLDSPAAQAIMIQVADAVAHCHRCQVAHRDLKPENIAVKPSGVAMLLDFGLAISTEDPVVENCGTVPFGPPEVYRVQAYDPKTMDVWGLGVLLLHAVCGKYSLFYMMGYDKAPNHDSELADALEQFFNPDEMTPWPSKIKKWKPEIEISACVLAAMRAAIVIDPKSRCSASKFVELFGCGTRVDRTSLEQASPSSLPTSRFAAERHAPDIE